MIQVNFGTLEPDGDDDGDKDGPGELWDTQPAKPEECVATNHTAAGTCNLMR